MYMNTKTCTAKPEKLVRGNGGIKKKKKDKHIDIERKLASGGTLHSDGEKDDPEMEQEVYYIGPHNQEVNDDRGIVVCVLETYRDRNILVAISLLQC